MTQGLLFNPRILTEDQLLAIYNKAVAMVLEGKVFMQMSGEGTELTAKFPIPVEQVLSEASYALQQINPSTYGHLLQQIKPMFI